MLSSDDAHQPAKDFKMKFTWTREVGNPKDGEETITVKRNTITTVTLNLLGGDQSLQFKVNESFEDLFNNEHKQQVTVD